MSCLGKIAESDLWCTDVVARPQEPRSAGAAVGRPRRGRCVKRCPTKENWASSAPCLLDDGEPEWVREHARKEKKDKVLRRRLELEERLKAIRRKEAMDKANYNYNKNNSINSYRVGEARDFKKTVVMNHCYSISIPIADEQ